MSRLRLLHIRMLEHRADRHRRAAIRLAWRALVVRERRRW